MSTRPFWIFTDVIYVEEKHGGIEIKKLAGHGIYTNMRELTELFSSGQSLGSRLLAVMPLLKHELQLSNLYYIGDRGILRSVIEPDVHIPAGDPAPLMTDALYQDHSLDRIEAHCPALCTFLHSRRIETVLFLRIGPEEKTEGYLICAEPRVQRLWQEAELGLLFYLAGLISSHIREHHDPLPQ